MIRTAAALALALTALPAAAEDAPYHPDCDRIDAFLGKMVADGRTVGAAALVWKDGAEACFEAAGDADRESARPMTRDTLFQIYSMTKPVTGVALMQLWEQGRFGLDDPLGKHLPELQSPLCDVTVGQALDMSGGLPDTRECLSLLGLSVYTETKAGPLLEYLSRLTRLN